MPELVALEKPRVPARYRTGFGFGMSTTVLVFFLMGLAFLPRLGFEYDEVMFAQLIFQPAKSVFAARINHHFIPVMQMSYIGALKVWLYWPLLKFWKADVYSVRVPVLILASATVFVVAETVRRTASVRSAILTGALLATDVSFLLTETFDWGPVVIQNFLLSVALYGLLVKRKSALGLPLAGFAFGMAIWDKAIFLWIFTGLCVSGVFFGRRAFTREASPKKLLAGAVAFAVGISPLIVYNLKRRNETLGNSAHFSLSDVGPKFTFVRIALNGQAFHEFFADRNAPVRNVTGGRAGTAFIPNPSSWRWLAFTFLLLGGTACARRENRRLILWLTFAVLLAWIQSAITKGAGTFVHHVVIFYPALFIAVGIAAEEVANRLGSGGTVMYAIVGVLLCGAGLNTIYVQFRNVENFSPTTFWTDADERLAEYVASRSPRQILVADWGIGTQLGVRRSGSLPIGEISFSLKDGNCTTQEAQQWAESRSLIVSHTAGHEMFPNQQEKLAQLARASGLAVVSVATINDRGGHPMFEIQELVHPAGG